MCLMIELLKEENCTKNKNLTSIRFLQNDMEIVKRIMFEQSGASEERGSAEGSRDKAVLTLQLHETEKEMVRLKSQVRRLEIELEREREKYTPLAPSESASDREKVS